MFKITHHDNGKNEDNSHTIGFKSCEECELSESIPEIALGFVYGTGPDIESAMEEFRDALGNFIAELQETYDKLYQLTPVEVDDRGKPFTK